MDQEAKIRQFRQMAEADPANELGHFSLGKACLDAGRPGEAIPALQRTIELSEKMSKAYQLLGQALNDADRREEAIACLQQGMRVANAQGDRMPLEAMRDLLQQWGAQVPEIAQAAAAPAHTPATVGEASASGFKCSRCGRPDHRLPKPPFKGDLGQRIHRQVCEGCWREWIPMGTKVINELGLSLADPRAQQAYDEYMVEFLQLQEA